MSLNSALGSRDRINVAVSESKLFYYYVFKEATGRTAKNYS